MSWLFVLAAGFKSPRRCHELSMQQGLAPVTEHVETWARSHASRTQGRGAPRLVVRSERRDARGGARSQEQLDRDALEQHFASIQSIPEQKTMPTLLPSLAGALMRAADTAPLKEQLRWVCMLCSGCTRALRSTLAFLGQLACSTAVALSRVLHQPRCMLYNQIRQFGQASL